MISVSRMVFCLVVAGVSFTAVVRAQDFDGSPILPIVPELGAHDKPKPKASPKAPAANDAALEKITFPSFPDVPAQAAVVSETAPPVPTAADAQKGNALDNVVEQLKSAPVSAAPVAEVPSPPAAPEVPAIAAPEVAKEPPQADAKQAEVSNVQAPEVPALESPAPEQVQAQPTAAPEISAQTAKPDNPEVAAADESADQLSLGDFEYSLMFAPEDMNTLKRVLLAYEVRKTQVADGTEKDSSESDLLAELLRNAKGEDIPEELLEEQAAVPATLPAFYLGSVVFNHKGDWTLWVNQKQASARKREIPELGITVRAVSREYATLAWKPENLPEVKARWDEIKEAGTDAPREWKHREVRGARIDYDKDKQEFVVSMRANQTFYANTMQVFEGRRTIDIPVLADATAGAAGVDASGANNVLGVFDPKEPGAQPSNAANTQPAGQSSDGVGKERAAANKLINNLKAATGAISSIAGGGSKTDAPANPPPAQ